MKITLFYHSLASDWNHGNAHFLRGIARELLLRGHDATVYEPRDSWSLSNLIKDHGKEKAEEFHEYYPLLKPAFHDGTRSELERIVRGSDLVIVHEWNSPELIATIGELKEEYGYQLLFHDTHHRAVSAPDSLSALDLTRYDGALVFGEILSDMYRERGWTSRMWTWHEAADVKLFKPLPETEKEGDLVWIGNWGDDERSAELTEFLIRPVKELGLSATVYGVRYPEHARKALEEAGIKYRGWLPNYRVPEVFARYRLTVHVPRRYYTQTLPGIPTIRPFEALACGIPLISAPWEDAEHLFRKGTDYLMVHDGSEMKTQIQRVLNDQELARHLARNGRKHILDCHTCSHRVDELETICYELGLAESMIHPKATV